MCASGLRAESHRGYSGSTGCWEFQAILPSDGLSGGSSTPLFGHVDVGFKGQQGQHGFQIGGVGDQIPLINVIKVMTWT